MIQEELRRKAKLADDLGAPQVDQEAEVMLDMFLFPSGARPRQYEPYKNGSPFEGTSAN